jgi:hypothetical protein
MLIDFMIPLTCHRYQLHVPETRGQRATWHPCSCNCHCFNSSVVSGAATFVGTAEFMCQVSMRDLSVSSSQSPFTSSSIHIRQSLILIPIIAQVEATVSTFSPDCARPADILPRVMAAANALPTVRCNHVFEVDIVGSGGADDDDIHNLSLNNYCYGNYKIFIYSSTAVFARLPVFFTPLCVQIPSCSDVERRVRRWGPCTSKPDIC